MPDDTPPSLGFRTLPPDVAEARRQKHAERLARETREAEEGTHSVRRLSLSIAGALFFATGMYYLVIAPAVGESETVNLQRLAMGETFTIVGAIFAGFAWRPRA